MGCRVRRTFEVGFADGVSEATRLVNEKGIKIRVITEIKKDNLESVIPLSKMS